MGMKGERGMKTTDWMNVIKKSLIFAVITFLVSGAATGLVSALVQKEVLSLTMAKTASVIIVCVVMFFMSIMAAKRVGCRKMIVALITGAATVLLLLVTKLIAFPAAKIEGALKILLVIAAAAVGGLTTGQKKARR